MAAPGAYFVHVKILGQMCDAHVHVRQTVLWSYETLEHQLRSHELYSWTCCSTNRSALTEQSIKLMKSGLVSSLHGIFGNVVIGGSMMNDRSRATCAQENGVLVQDSDMGSTIVSILHFGSSAMLKSSLPHILHAIHKRRHRTPYAYGRCLQGRSGLAWHP